MFCVREELCRWCSRRLAWVIGGGSQVVDEHVEETRQTLLSPKSYSLESGDSFPQAPMERKCSVFDEHRGKAPSSRDEYAFWKVPHAASSHTSASSQPLDTPQGSRRVQAHVADGTELEVMRSGSRQTGYANSDTAQAEVELRRSGAGSAEDHPIHDRAPSSSQERRAPLTPAKAFNDLSEGTARTISESTDTFIQSFVHVTEIVREADFSEHAANAVGTAAIVASTAGNAAVSAAEVMRSSLAHVGDKGVSETLSRGAVQAANTLHTTGKVAQQRVVEAKTVCQSHVPKAAAVAALAAGVAKDRFAKASHGFAGMFRRSQAAPTCRFCTSTMHWSDHAEGTYASGWYCENVTTCGSCSTSQGSWRWFCPMCQNHDLCTDCALQDGRKQFDSPPRHAPNSPDRKSVV